MSAKEAAKAGLAELAKRVPPNQSLQFQAFQAKHTEYHARVNKNPEKLPKIDWDYYRRNVRPEAKDWVDEFQQKYEAVCQTFDKRAKQDYSKYYKDLEKVRCEMQADIEQFKNESNDRIKLLQEEYERIKALKPYEDMTAEEYSDLLPEKSMFTFEGRPSFWPHTLEEQSLEPPVKSHHGDDHGDDEKPKKSGTSDGSGDAAPSGSSSSAAENEKKDAKEAPKGDAKAAKAMTGSTNLSADAEQRQRSSISILKPLGSLSVKKIDEKSSDLATQLMEEEIEREVMYASLEHPLNKERLKMALKK